MRKKNLTWCGVGLATGLLVLASCNVGPDYHKPATTMPSSWTPPATSPTTVPSKTDSAKVELIRWWKTFNDPLLDSLIERAVAANLTVLQADARIRQARASIGVAESAFWPTLNANGSYVQSGSDVQPTTWNWRAGFDAAWEIDVFGGTRRSVEAARANLEVSLDQRRAALITLMGDVASTYLDLRAAQGSIAIAQSNLVAQEKTLALTQRKQGAGFVGSLDVANAQSQVASTKSVIPSLEQRVRSDIYALSVLLALKPAELVDELTPLTNVTVTPPVVPVGLPSDLLRRRPDIRQAEAGIHAATANIGVATADLFPKFAITASASRNSNSFNQVLNWNSPGWSWGPGVSWNLFNGGQTLSNIKVQEALRDQAFLSYKQTVLTALQDVETALVAYEKEQEHRRILYDALQANRKAVDLSLLLYGQGEIEFLNVLNAQRSLLGSEDAYSNSTYNVATDLIALYKALGGGWEDNAFPSTQPTTKPDFNWTP